MPTYVYEDCEWCGDNDGSTFEKNVPIKDRDNQQCEACGCEYKRKVAFTGLTWAPTAGGMR